jgi:hypothetical protein
VAAKRSFRLSEKRWDQRASEKHPTFPFPYYGSELQMYGIGHPNYIERVAELDEKVERFSPYGVEKRPDSR